MEHTPCEDLSAVVEHADLGRGGTGIDDKNSHATNGTLPTRLEVKLGRDCKGEGYDESST